MEKDEIQTTHELGNLLWGPICMVCTKYVCIMQT